MESFFSGEFFAGNRAALRAKAGSGTPVVITGNGSMQQAGDEPTKFHQDSNFWYLTGISSPDLVLVIGPKEDYLIVPARSFDRAAFDGAHDTAGYGARSGIATILDAKAGWEKLRGELKASQKAAVLASPPTFLPRYGLHTLPYRRRLIEKLKRLAPGITLQDVRPELARLRCLKQPAELGALQRAIDITTETLQEVASGAALRAARHEYELEAAISYGFRHRGAAGHAFEPIVGAGKDATTLHHVRNDSPVVAGELVVLDVGASVEHYAADVTRTVSQQPFSRRQADIFQAVATVQDIALGLLRPGTKLREYEAAVGQAMGQQLKQLGLVTAATADQIHRYYPHATSHFLGLDVHDVGDAREPLAEGMVLTCEPGIYIPEEGIGVRIEDDVLITKDGCKVLSAACPRELTRVQ